MVNVVLNYDEIGIIGRKTVKEEKQYEDDEFSYQTLLSGFRRVCKKAESVTSVYLHIIFNDFSFVVYYDSISDYEVDMVTVKASKSVGYIYDIDCMKRGELKKYIERKREKK